MPHYFGSNILNTGESCEGAIEGCSVSLSFFFLQSFLFFSKRLAMFSVFSFKKCGGLNRSDTGDKPVINTAWPLISQTREYQQDLETTPKTTLTCLRFEHRKRNWGKKPLSTLDGP